jgi:integrase
VKWGAYYGRWTTPDGRRVNRRIGKVRARCESDGLTRTEAERGLRQLIEAEARRPPRAPEQRPPTVDEVADELRGRLEIEGARLSYRQNCKSMQRVHVSPALGKRRVDTVKREDVERLARAMLKRGLAPKTVRNVMTFLRSVFALAEESRVVGNPVARAARPRCRREGDADPDLQFLTLPALDAVIAATPDRTVDRDAISPVLRLVILAAATSGLRQSELLGLHWKHVDMRAQRIRVRNAWVRYEHSGEGKSDLSTKRSVPMTDRLAAEFKRWRLRTVFSDDEDLVFAHPELGVELDRTKVTRRFRLPASRPVCAQSASRIFATRSRPRSPQPACRCAPSRSTLATPTSRRRRFTPTTPHRHARCRSSTRRLDCPNGRTGRVGAHARCRRDGISAGVQCHGATSKAADRFS